MLSSTSDFRRTTFPIRIGEPFPIHIDLNMIPAWHLMRVLAKLLGFPFQPVA